MLLQQFSSPYSCMLTFDKITDNTQCVQWRVLDGLCACMHACVRACVCVCVCMHESLVLSVVSTLGMECCCRSPVRAGPPGQFRIRAGLRKPFPLIHGWCLWSGCSILARHVCQDICSTLYFSCMNRISSDVPGDKGPML